MKHLLRRSPQIAPGESIARLDDVSKSFGEQPIINGVNLDVKKGEFVVMTGPSGSGKSTILRTIAGLERPNDGAVEVMGRQLYSLKESERDKLIAKHVGVGFQAHNLDTGLTVLDNIESLAEAKGRVDSHRVGKLVVAFGLQEKIMRRESVASLSGGEKQRLALGRLLVPKPDLVLLDEPTAAIDPHGKEAIYATLRELNEQEGTTFVIISHDEVARGYADREVVVESGVIVSGNPLTPVTPAA